MAGMIPKVVGIMVFLTALAGFTVLVRLIVRAVDGEWITWKNAFGLTMALSGVSAVARFTAGQIGGSPLVAIGLGLAGYQLVYQYMAKLSWPKSVLAAILHLIGVLVIVLVVVTAAAFGLFAWMMATP